MNTNNKLTREYFCTVYPEMKMVRRNNNYNFEIYFNDWKHYSNKENLSRN